MWCAIPSTCVISHADHYGRPSTLHRHHELRRTQVGHAASHSVFELQCSWSRTCRELDRPAPSRAPCHALRGHASAPAERPSRGLVGFLGPAASDRDRLRRAIELSSFKALRKQEEEHRFRERSSCPAALLPRGQGGGLAREADRAQVEALVAVNEVQMRRFGYWPVKDWSPASSIAAPRREATRPPIPA